MTESIRLDKFLWAARFAKTRSVARDLVQSGKVTVNGQKVKPAKTVQVGDLVKCPRGYDVYEIEILALSEQRRSAQEAAKLFQETTESQTKREAQAELRKLNALYNPHPDTKPDKKQRRDLLKFKNS
ncbi:RNA-binding S4 domain-containing protein [Pseudidiomarina mangrovi]|uniref:RNA-binding S4 domain-containing protein n=1 Tax=Pseudidiomarina mangrovi TaxID=2487133 RepID=UPI000FCCA8F3|nr:S4 domain-containing protein [Pseudidiomarina mangrovi]CAI8154133.1 MAG: Heat shock protein 15 [Pseudidiomarina mangrovi]